MTSASARTTAVEIAVIPVRPSKRTGHRSFGELSEEAVVGVLSFKVTVPAPTASTTTATASGLSLVSRTGQEAE